jgi:hypothetical protein
MRKPSFVGSLTRLLIAAPLILLLVACGAVTATPTATLAPRPTDLPEATIPATPAPEPTSVPRPTSAARPTTELQPTSETNATTNNVVQIDSLEDYQYKTGLFSIKVPQGWTVAEGGSDTISVSWVAPEQNSGIFVGLRASAEILNQDQLTEFGTTYVQAVFGTEQNFELGTVEPQQDESVLIPFRMTSIINDNAVNLYGLTYVEQRGDKVSALTVLFPAEGSEQLWENYFKEIVNSYRIDESISIP